MSRGKTKVRPSQVFATRLREIRTARGLTQAALAQAMTDAGQPLNKIALLRIESGQRGISLDEALALAQVLYVAPAHLLSPPEGEIVWTTENHGMDGAGLRNWLLFGDPLLLTDEGQRVRRRIPLALTIEAQAQALVDARRGGDQAGADAAVKAIEATIEAEMRRPKEEGGTNAS